MGIKYMIFGEALEALKKGKRVLREGWNSKNMFLYLENFEWVKTDPDYKFEKCIVMFTTSGKWQPGWLASQSDMLSEDWLILE